MKNYYSVTHSTSNENGHEQLEIEHEKIFLRWLFRKPAKIEVFIKKTLFSKWINKDTGKQVSFDDHFKIENIILNLNFNRNW